MLASGGDPEQLRLSYIAGYIERYIEVKERAVAQCEGVRTG